MSGRGMRVAACLAVCVTVAATFSGCDRLVFGAKAREARVLGAVRTGDAYFFGTSRPLHIVRRWIAPPLLGVELFVVETDEHHPRYLVALDNRGIPVILKGVERRSEVASTPANHLPALPWINSLIQQSGVTIATEAEARQLARLVVTLAATPVEPIVVGEGDSIADSITVAVDPHGVPCSANRHAVAVAQRDAEGNLSFWDVTLCVVYSYKPVQAQWERLWHTVNWDLHIAADGQVSRPMRETRRAAITPPSRPASRRAPSSRATSPPR